MAKIPGYITIKDYADKLNITARRVNELILRDRINGAVKIGNTWLIPERTDDIRDKRYTK